MLDRILRFYGLLFHFVLALFLFALASLSKISGHDLKLDLLPWKDEVLTNWLFWGALLGLIAVLLAVFRVFRYLYPLWALTVLVMLLRGVFLSPYQFNGKTDFYWTLAFVAGTLGAFLCSLMEFKRRR